LLTLFEISTCGYLFRLFSKSVASLPSGIGDRRLFWPYFGPFGCIAPKTLNYLAFLVWLANLNTDRKHKSNIRDSILVIRDTLISFHGFIFILYH
jgi:hypothetical protein